MRAPLAALLLLVAVGAAAGPPPPNPIPCGPPVPNVTAFVVYNGPQSGCTASNGNCAAAEPVAFNVGTFGYNLACMPFTITWDFGDGGTASGVAVTHAYAAPGVYAASATLGFFANSHMVLTAPVVVVASVPATSPRTLIVLAIALAAIGMARIHRLV